MVELLLAKKAKNPALEVRIIADTLGTDGQLWSSPASRDNLQRLSDAGCEVVWNGYLGNGMEHRKLFVIDGEKALFGGACLSAEYYATPEYRALKAQAATGDEAAIDALVALEKTPQGQEPEFHDYGVLFQGSAARQLQASFLQSWLIQGKPLDPHLDDAALVKKHFPPSEQSPLGTAVKISHSVPTAESQIGDRLKQVVRSAEKKLDCAFAYVLIPEFVREVVAAARRGARIRILVPGEEGIDRSLAFHAFRHTYGGLFAAGDVRIFETPFYTHLKAVVSDDTRVFLSTGNPEWFSWSNGWDEIALFDSPAMAAEVNRRIFERDLQPERSTEVDREAYAQTGYLRQAHQRAARLVFDTLFSPRSELPRQVPSTRMPGTWPDDPTYK
jgi:phosphatidylserine/phosphatidylglycerophosphate/cardiolipin synthase-like enzyme